MSPRAIFRELDYNLDYFGQKQIDASQAGGGREGLNFQEIGKMSFMFPSNQEQMKIGVYFNHIDYLITLHQCK